MHSPDDAVRTALSSLVSGISANHYSCSVDSVCSQTIARVTSLMEQRRAGEASLACAPPPPPPPPSLSHSQPLVESPPISHSLPLTEPQPPDAPPLSWVVLLQLTPYQLALHICMVSDEFWAAVRARELVACVNVQADDAHTAPNWYALRAWRGARTSRLRQQVLETRDHITRATLIDHMTLAADILRESFCHLDAVALCVGAVSHLYVCVGSREHKRW